MTTATGLEISYGDLVWAAGGRAPRLSCPGHDLAGIYNIRTRGDVDRIRAELPGVDRVIVVGGGFIGLEAAAILAKAGKRVTLLEAQDRVFAWVAGQSLSNFYEREHRSHGVELRLGAAVSALLGERGHVSAVWLVESDPHLYPDLTFGLPLLRKHERAHQIFRRFSLPGTTPWPSAATSPVPCVTCPD